MIESAEEFVRLRGSSDPVEYRRAAHEEASIEVWTDIIARFPEMRSWVAHNKTVPVEVLRRLARDNDPLVRCAVADKRKLTRELFRQLAGDQDAVVRSRLTYNRKVPSDVLETLAADPVPLVRDAALNALSRRQES